ncbi:uncharacterized protein [Typha latifolia]|uniref:uncharacterized protein n=1 Tax=Typha latifolia TaxID=4733 RepID=UPI003C2F9D51
MELTDRKVQLFCTMDLAKVHDKKKIEIVHEALHQLMEERKHKGIDKEEEEEESLLLSRLISQLDLIEKGSGFIHSCDDLLEKAESSESNIVDCRTAEMGLDEIAKELRRVKRQNLITHCLLSVLIVATALWQVSEVSILLMVKEKFSNPLRTVGDIIKRSLTGKKAEIEGAPLPPISVPELPHMDLPTLTLSGGD